MSESSHWHNISMEFILKTNEPRTEPWEHRIQFPTFSNSGAMGKIAEIGEYKLKRLRWKSIPM